MPQEEKDTVEVPSIAYEQMAAKWPLLHDLLGGTDAMRKAGARWLPKETAEESLAYANRLNRSILYNAYADTIRKFVSKPFSRDVALQGRPPGRLDGLEEDVDRTGRNLTQLGRDMFRAGAVYGLTHALVDFPQMQEGATLADERSAQPTLIHVTPPQLIGWRTREGEGGNQRLTRVRIYETRTEPAGQFREHEVEYIRVFTEADWQVWRKTGDDEEYQLESEGGHSFGEVPIVTYYTNRTGFMTADPPMEDLAWLNLAHWQSLSDQRHILRYSRVPMMHMSGVTPEEMDTAMTIGPSQFIRSENADARIQWVEHSGAAIGAGQDDLKHLEDRMEVLGLQPLVQRSGDVTATGRAIDEARSHTDIQAWIRSLENTMTEMYRMAGRWVNAEIPEDFRVDIHDDFNISRRSSEEMESLIKMRQSGEIAQETLLREAKRRGLLSESMDVDEEVEAVRSEGPALSLVGVGDAPA